MIGIYKIVNPKGKVYIGQSINIEKRIKDYKYSLAKQQPKLNRSFVKYGYENHVFSIIDECEVSELNDKERYYQELYNCIGSMGLNLSYVKSTDRNGFHSEETKLKISINNPKNRLGTKLTDKQKEHLRNINLGKKASISTRNKISNSLKGVNKGKKHTEETKLKLREINLGKKASEETKLKMSNIQSKMSIDVKNKRAEGVRNYYKNNISHMLGKKLPKKHLDNIKIGHQKMIILDNDTGIFYFSLSDIKRTYNISIIN